MKVRLIPAALVFTVLFPLIAAATAEPKPSRVAFASSARQVLDGESVTLTATVEGIGDSAVPSGSVEFFDGATSLGTAQLAATQGRAHGSLSVTLGVGPHPILIKYAGDNIFGGSMSVPEFVVVLAR